MTSKTERNVKKVLIHSKALMRWSIALVHSEQRERERERERDEREMREMGERAR